MFTTSNKKCKHNLATWIASDDSNVALDGNLTEEEQQQPERKLKELQEDKKRQPRITTCPASFADTNNQVCDLCGKQFSLKQAQQNHTKYQVCTKPKVQYNGSFVCPLRGKNFLSKEAQQNHTKYQVYVNAKVRAKAKGAEQTAKATVTTMSLDDF
jgi:hypothetical protein